MRRHRSIPLSLGLALVWVVAAGAGPAGAAPIATTASATLTFRSLEFGGIQVAGNGSITVDVANGTLQVPAGLISVPGPVLAPVTASTQLSALRLDNVQNLAGTFQVGGATTQVTGEICPTAGPALGEACVGGGSLGGTLGFVGSLGFVVITNVATYGFPLAPMQIGLGGEGTFSGIPFGAAPWTLGTGQVAYAAGYVTSLATGTSLGLASGSGSLAAGQLKLVTPSYILLAGRAVPFVTTLELTFSVPEPEIGLLLAFASVGLARCLRDARRRD